MRKTALTLTATLLATACAAPVSSDGEGGEMTINGGDGDVNGTTGGNAPVLGSGGTAPVGTGGTAPVGTGGTTPVGTGGTTPVGTGGTPSTTPVVCSGSGFTVNNGYVDNGTMCGFAWTGAYGDNGTVPTIEPPCGTGTCFTGATVCASTEIPAQNDAMMYYPGAMIGWNVSQPADGGAAGSWTATGTGLTPTFTATGATGAIRVVVQSGGIDYCAAATSGVAIPWSGFTQSCWAPGGTAFTAGSQVEAVLLQVNATTTAQTVSSLCLEGMTLN